MSVSSIVRLGTYKNVSLSVWLGNPGLSEIGKIRSQYQTLAQMPSAKFGSLVVIHSLVRDHVGDEVRKASAALRSDFSNNLLGEAQVLELQGFHATAARLVLRTIRLIKPPTYPCEIFDNSAGAVAWLASRVGLPAQELQGALDRLKRDAGIL